MDSKIEETNNKGTVVDEVEYDYECYGNDGSTRKSECVTSSENPYYGRFETRVERLSTNTFVRFNSNESLGIEFGDTDTFQRVSIFENPYYGDVISTSKKVNVSNINSENNITTKDSTMCNSENNVMDSKGIDLCANANICGQTGPGTCSELFEDEKNDPNVKEKDEFTEIRDRSQVPNQRQNSSVYCLSNGMVLNLAAGEVQYQSNSNDDL